MNPEILIGLVDYIQLLHKGKLDKSLFTYFEKELKNCSPREVNIAIENLIIRYKNVDGIEITVAKFIRAAMLGLEDQSKPEYPPDSIFHILDKENRVIEAMLRNLKKTYITALPDLKANLKKSKTLFKEELEKLEMIKAHYLKLQYGVFSALESEDAPTRCIQLMWALEDSVWLKHKDC